MPVPATFVPYKWLDGMRLMGGMEMNTMFQQALFDAGTANAIVAHAGGGQALATPLTNGINRVTTVVTAGDSVGLPLAIAGLSLSISNAGAAAMQVFSAPGSTDTINGVAGSTGISQAVNKTNFYFCAVAGVWSACLSA